MILKCYYPMNSLHKLLLSFYLIGKHFHISIKHNLECIQLLQGDNNDIELR